MPGPPLSRPHPSRPHRSRQTTRIRHNCNTLPVFLDTTHQPRAVSAAMRAARTLPLLLPLALAACGGGGPRVATRPLHPGGGSYTAPGPASDPWRPYIRDASARFNVPEKWIRAVMRQESGGHEYLNGEPITSSAGAMGLMQLMPATYADMRDRYGLGDDPYA